MVKPLLLLFLAFSWSHGQDLLLQKIQNLVGERTFTKDRAFIETIFTPKSDYYGGDGSVDAIRVVKTLKENGVIKLFFKTPREIDVSFKTEGSPLLFAKIMSDTLQNVGYYKYITKESTFEEESLLWKINLTSEYAPDPIILAQELQKNGCQITDVVRKNDNEWEYRIDTSKAKLNVSTLEGGVPFNLKRSLYAYWLDASQIGTLDIVSSLRNEWYPYIAFYDKSLKLLSVIRMDTKKTNITLEITPQTHYIKISDIYTLKNIKDDLVLTPLWRKD